MATPCTKCGNMLEDTARFCGACGNVVEARPAPVAPVPAPAPAAAPPASPSASRTMLGFQAIPAPPATVPIVPPAPSDTTPMQAVPEPGPSAPAKSSARTMLGIPSPLAGAPAPAPAPVQAAAPAPAPAPGPTGPVGAKTMLGVAIPGIAPVQPEPRPAPMMGGPTGSKTMLGVAAPGIAPLDRSGVQPGGGPTGSKTMLGVAAPGIAPMHQAPVHQPPLALPPVVPPPAPLVDEPLPAPPPKVQRRGVPIVAVVAVLAVLLAAGGVLIALFVRSTPIVASPQLSADGKEQLHLKCESCKDGWTVRAGDRSATFSGGETNIDLPQPLRIGMNDVQLELDKGGSTREVHLQVDVDFRVRPVLDDLGATPPQLKIAVEISPPNTIQIDGKPIDVDRKGDAAGQGSWSAELGDVALGPSDETKTLERSVPYTVVIDGKPTSGAVSFRVPIAPLRVDAPGPAAIVETGAVVVTGRAAKGSKVLVGGQPAEVRADGTFEAKVDVAPGDHAIDVTSAYVKGDAPALATRTVKLAVKRVEKLEAEAAAQDKAHPLGWDALAGKVADNVGQPMVITGAVLEVRTANRQSVLVVDADRGCAKGPCITRVVYGGDVAFARGDYVRAYGKISRPVQTSDGKTVPEVEAAFALKGRKR